MGRGWFPGHMARARGELRRILPLLDVVVEVLDARIPRTSHDPALEGLVGRKPRVLALNKTDLADPRLTHAWIAWWERQGMRAVPIQAEKGEGLAALWQEVVDLAGGVAGKRRQRLGRPVRAACVGIPNVGKSSLINRIAGQKKARVGERPGITRGQQWLQASPELEILDTPGILRPRREEEGAFYRLAVTGALDEQEYDPVVLAEWLLHWLRSNYPQRLEGTPLVQVHPSRTPRDMLEAIGRARGCLAKGGKVDLERAARLFLHEYRHGRWGKFTLEKPEDFEE